MFVVDPRTVLLVCAALNLLLAGMLVLVSMQAPNVKGVRQWALADLCMGMTLGFGSQAEYPAAPFYAIIGAAFLGLSLGLVYTGVAAFKGDRSRPWVPVLVAAAILANNYIFGVVFFNAQIRISLNFLIVGVVYGICARALFIRIEQPLRTAYWLAAGSMALFTLIAIARIINVLTSPPQDVSMFTSSGINPLLLLLTILMQMSMSFAFMLLVNYTLSHQLNALATTDALTGLLNRRNLETLANRQLAHSKRTGESMAIMMIDVDHFKRINDQYGHQAGDEVLRRLAHLMQSIVRGNDYLARYGGEEFCILLPVTTEEQAYVLAERLRRLYAELIVPWQHHALRGTISVGIADSNSDAEDIPALIAHADLALYDAKRRGRDQVITYSQYASELLQTKSHADAPAHAE